jgi:hypothetical protein
VKRLGVILLLVAAAATASARPAAPATSDPCALPRTKPVWIDFADGSVPFWELFAQPGVVAAAANFIYPPLLRAHGAQTVYWDMNLRSRVGTPTDPLDPATVIDRANRLYTYASDSMACSDPVITENELFGASTVTPWSPTNAQYRANVLLYLRTLAQRGAHPVLLVSSPPYTDNEAGDWWRQAAQVADIVREVYFPAPRIYKQGPILGSRSLRQLFRSGATDFISIGIPPSRLGIMLGFHTTPGTGGREQLRPTSAWLEVTKLQALAAKQVARDLHLAHVWSWGWGVWSAGENDPDKPKAACVYLWTRNPKLCDAPKYAASFDTSLTEGQLIFPRGVRCTVYGTAVKSSVILGLTRLTGDGQAAFTAAYARAVASASARVSARAVLAAERAIVQLRFGGSRSAYYAALSRARASVSTARGVIADELRRAAIEARLRPAAVSSDEILSYYQTYGDLPARLIESSPAAPWLGRARRGYALAQTAPAQVFRIQSGVRTTVRTMLGTFKVRPLGPAMPLGELPLAKARFAIAAALASLHREQAYQTWLVARENAALAQTLCWRDQLPALDVVPLTDYLPFAALDETATNAGTISARP